MFLNYAATHPDTTICYHASGMSLHIDSDASYLSVTKARSRVGGNYFLSSPSAKPNQQPTAILPPNGTIYAVCNILRNVMPSAAEAECGALFVNGKESVVLRTTLYELDHPQQPNPLKTENSRTYGIANDTIRQRRSRAMDMRFYCVCNRVLQGQFIIYLRPGTENLGDYYKKHHPLSHHRAMRSKFLHPNEHSPLLLRGCVNLTGNTSAPGRTRPSISALHAQPRTSGRRLKPLFAALAVRLQSAVSN